jgi:ferritin-like metal-binding protein YciE
LPVSLPTPRGKGCYEPPECWREDVKEDEMKLRSLEDVLIDAIKDLYSAEKQITKALPKMAKKASSKELSAAFEEHLRQTEGQIKRLERVFEIVGKRPAGKKCHAIEGLIAEGEEMMKQDAEPAALDAGLIAAAQKVEHYEIASYGCARTWASQLGHDDAAKLLQETLDEEGETDKKLTKLAEGLVNPKAA